jgi:hypothetical protein
MEMGLTVIKGRMASRNTSIIDGTALLKINLSYSRTMYRAGYKPAGDYLCNGGNLEEL